MKQSGRHRLRRLGSLKGVLFFLWILLPAQAFAAELFIREIRIEGTVHTREAQLREAIQVQPGQDVARWDVQQLLRDDVKRLARREGVQDVTVTTEPLQDGVRLIFEILEYPLLADIRFSGNRKYDDNRLRRELGFLKRAGLWGTERAEVFYSPQLLRQYLEQLQQLYQEKGFAAVTLTSQLEDETEESVVLHFNVKEGKKQVVAGTRFDGNAAFTDQQLLKGARLKTRKSWVPFFPKKYDQLMVDEDLLRIQRFYEDAGYYRVVARQGESESVKDGKGVIVHFTIVEGPSYDFGQVRLEGNRIFSDAELLKDRYCLPGARFSRTELERDAIAMGDRYRNQGYLYTRIEPLLTPREDEEAGEYRIDLTWEIRESDRYRLRQVRPQGVVELDDGSVEEVPLKTKDFVILRELELEPGDVLDWSRVRRSERNLLNLGYFKREENVYPARLKFGFQPEVTEEEELLDLALRLEEEPTGLVTFGAGYSTTFGPSVFGSIQESNLFGRGWRGNLAGSFGTRRQSVNVNFTEPHLFNSDYSLGVDFYRLFREAFGGREFDETRTGGSLRLGWEIVEDLRAAVRYKYERIEIGDIDVSGLQDTIRPDPYVEGTSTTSSFELSLIHDTRDYILFPSQGHRYAASAECAGLGGDNEFWKLTGNASWYHLVVGKLVFAYDLEAGLAQGYGGTEILPLHERFFAGGANSIRGFEEGSVGPRGIYAVTRRIRDGYVYSDIDDVVIGGELELVARTELRYPFTDQLQGVVFFDTGAAWEELSDLDLSELRFSTGVGVRINLPIGAAVRLDLAVPLKKESEDDTQYFHFGFNQSF